MVAGPGWAALEAAAEPGVAAFEAAAGLGEPASEAAAAGPGGGSFEAAADPAGAGGCLPDRAAMAVASRVAASWSRSGVSAAHRAALAFNTAIAAYRSERLLSFVLQGYPAFEGLTWLPNLHDRLVPMAAMPPAHCLEPICQDVSIECRRRQQRQLLSTPGPLDATEQQLSLAAGCNTPHSSKARFEALVPLRSLPKAATSGRAHFSFVSLSSETPPAAGCWLHYNTLPSSTELLRPCTRQPRQAKLPSSCMP